LPPMSRPTQGQSTPTIRHYRVKIVIAGGVSNAGLNKFVQNINIDLTLKPTSKEVGFSVFKINQSTIDLYNQFKLLTLKLSLSAIKSLLPSVVTHLG
jgi:hypothetical protein